MIRGGDVLTLVGDILTSGGDVLTSGGDVLSSGGDVLTKMRTFWLNDVFTKYLAWRIWGVESERVNYNNLF